MEPTIVLYDIATVPRESTCGPNPWKARYALNFKAVAYSTQWVQFPDITKVRRGLGVPPCRKFADGTDYYTLPFIIDSKTGTAVGDSIDIAGYLQDTFHEAGAGDLFPPQKLDYKCPSTGDFYAPLSELSDKANPAYAQFNSNVDMAFSLHVQLTTYKSHWDPALKDEIEREFARRAGLKSWDEIKIHGEARARMVVSLRDTLRDLADMLQRDGTGPFILGSQPSFADIIIGGWLRFFSITLPDSEWNEIAAWYDGVFGKLHTTLQQRFGDIK